jgi:hypothetical protein
MVARPRLRQQFRPLRRGDGRVQLGLDPVLGVLLEGLCEAEVELLERLDGTLDEQAATAWAGQHGIPPERVATLLGTLRAHALTVDSPAHRLDVAGLPGPLRASLRPDAEALACAYRRDDDGYALLARRARQSVLIDGCGGLPFALSQVLRQAGVGSVTSGRYAAAASPSPGPDLVVLAGSDALDPARAAGWMRAGTPHLPLVLRGTGAEVGPLVRPGTGPCLRCLDLTRADLDPGWPAVLAQLTRPAVGPPPETSGETSLVHAAAGLAAMLVLPALDGQDVTCGLSLEIGLRLPHVEQRIWPAHPHCSCSRTDHVWRPAAPAQRAQATMAG